MKKVGWILIVILIILLLIILKFVIPYIVTYRIMSDCFKYELLMERPHQGDNFINLKRGEDGADNLNKFKIYINLKEVKEIDASFLLPEEIKKIDLEINSGDVIELVPILDNGFICCEVGKNCPKEIVS